MQKEVEELKDAIRVSYFQPRLSNIVNIHVYIKVMNQAF